MLRTDIGAGGGGGRDWIEQLEAIARPPAAAITGESAGLGLHDLAVRVPWPLKTNKKPPNVQVTVLVATHGPVN